MQFLKENGGEEVLDKQGPSNFKSIWWHAKLHSEK
jgi:hypothetical protein